MARPIHSRGSRQPGCRDAGAQARNVRDPEIHGLIMTPIARRAADPRPQAVARPGCAVVPRATMAPCLPPLGS